MRGKKRSIVWDGCYGTPARARDRLIKAQQSSADSLGTMCSPEGRDGHSGNGGNDAQQLVSALDRRVFRPRSALAAVTVTSQPATHPFAPAITAPTRSWTALSGRLRKPEDAGSGRQSRTSMDLSDARVATTDGVDFQNKRSKIGTCSRVRLRQTHRGGSKKSCCRECDVLRGVRIVCHFRSPGRFLERRSVSCGAKWMCSDMTMFLNAMVFSVTSNSRDRRLAVRLPCEK